MKADKALELVQRYSALTREIKQLSSHIGTTLEKCRGISGKRLEVDRFGIPTQERKLNNRNQEIDLHLTDWYTPYQAGNIWSGPTLAWHEITLEHHQAECPHCYEAHMAIQKRKEARKALASVKGAMTRSTA